MDDKLKNNSFIGCNGFYWILMISTCLISNLSHLSQENELISDNLASVST